jgi:hypothetical protein
MREVRAVRAEFRVFSGVVCHVFVRWRLAEMTASRERCGRSGG